MKQHGTLLLDSMTSLARRWFVLGSSSGENRTRRHELGRGTCTCGCLTPGGKITDLPVALQSICLTQSATKRNTYGLYFTLNLYFWNAERDSLSRKFYDGFQCTNVWRVRWNNQICNISTRPWADSEIACSWTSLPAPATAACYFSGSSWPRRDIANLIVSSYSSHICA